MQMPGAGDRQTGGAAAADCAPGAVTAAPGLLDRASVSNVVLRSPKQREQSPEVPGGSEERGALPGD